MGQLKDEINEKVEKYMKSSYDIQEGYSIPDKKDVGFGAKAKLLKHVIVMYADLRDSRSILSDDSQLLTARAHKSFLYAASKCIRNEDGYMRSFNGDSVLSFFTGEDATKSAVRAAMKTKYAVEEIINPILEEKNKKQLNFGVGIGQGKVLVVKSGIPGEEIYQDLIWIGWSTYHAFEYGERARKPRNIWISRNVFNSIKDDDSMRYHDGKNMWVYDDSLTFTFGKVRIYKTSYRWVI